MKTNKRSDLLVRWTREDALELYGVRNWGHGYFDIDENGDLLVLPTGSAKDPAIKIPEIVAGLKTRGISLPVLLRFGDILNSRIQRVYSSFARAFEAYGYRGKYRGVYPIKVNQQHEVVEEIMEFGGEFHHGLEAGSKAELIAAIACVRDPESMVVCNGYKDEEFMDLALHAEKLGVRVVIVIERPSELDLILGRSKALCVKPTLGVRVRLASKSGGHWDDSAGDRSMFGLNTTQVIQIVDRLRQHNMLDCLKMLHYHLGSQITNIRSIRTAVHEASRFYVEMVKEGAEMGMLDIGGGLAVDYDGSHTNYESSRNYTEDEYATDVVEVIKSVAEEAGVDHPTIVTESGRATVAHHSVLIFNVLDSGSFDPSGMAIPGPDEPVHEMISNLQDVRDSFSRRNIQESYHDAVYYRDEIRTIFRHGDLSLRERAYAEDIFWEIVRKIAAHTRERRDVPDELKGLEAATGDVYYCNFSVFQSLPDSWAIDQLFPVMPVHRLCERPSRQAILADITCDSDGKIDRFIDLHDERRTLPLHPLGNDEYYLGVFLVGAYQETLGDLHNLLGDTNVLHIRMDRNGKVEYTDEIEGDTVADVLSYVEYEPAKLIRSVRNKAEKAVREERMTPEERRHIMAAYEKGMRGYTYFEN